MSAGCQPPRSSPAAHRQTPQTCPRSSGRCAAAGSRLHGWAGGNRACSARCAQLGVCSSPLGNLLAGTDEPSPRMRMLCCVPTRERPRRNAVPGVLLLAQRHQRAVKGGEEAAPNSKAAADAWRLPPDGLHSQGVGRVHRACAMLLAHAERQRRANRVWRALLLSICACELARRPKDDQLCRIPARKGLVCWLCLHCIPLFRMQAGLAARVVCKSRTQTPDKVVKTCGKGAAGSRRCRPQSGARWGCSSCP